MRTSCFLWQLFIPAEAVLRRKNIPKEFAILARQREVETEKDICKCRRPTLSRVSSKTDQKNKMFFRYQVRFLFVYCNAREAKTKEISDGLSSVNLHDVDCHVLEIFFLRNHLQLKLCKEASKLSSNNL